jgi:hypothetical protein
MFNAGHPERFSRASGVRNQLGHVQWIFPDEKEKSATR